MAARVAEVVELLDQKLDDAKGKTGVPAAASPAAPMAVDLSLQDARAELAKVTACAEKDALAAEKEKKELIAANAIERRQMTERLNALEAAAKASLVPRLSDEVQQQCGRTVMFAESELPVIKANPSKDTKLMLASLSANLTAWGQAGLAPLTFGQILYGTSPGLVAAALTNVKDVAGETIWERFYADKQVTVEMYVPFQLGNILNLSLMKAEATLKKFQKDFDLAEDAKKSFEAMQADDVEAKKCRKGPYSA
jgi:hypothetical protein